METTSSPAPPRLPLSARGLGSPSPRKFLFTPLSSPRPLPAPAAATERRRSRPTHESVKSTPITKPLILDVLDVTQTLESETQVLHLMRKSKGVHAGSSPRSHVRKDLVESGNSMVAEVTAFLAQRTKQRNTDTMRYLEMRNKMKPPPPMTMEELEQHPLAKQKAQKRSKQDREFDNGVDDDEKVDLPFIAKPTLDRDVMRKLRDEVRKVEHDLHTSMKASRPGSPTSTIGRLLLSSGSVGYSPRPPTNPHGDEEIDWNLHGTSSAQTRRVVRFSHVGTESPLMTEPDNQIAAPDEAFMLTAVDMDIQNKASTPGAVVAATAESPHDPLKSSSFSSPNGTASALSVRALGPEHDKQILSRDPQELRKIRNEDRHAQCYRGNGAVVDTPLPPVVNPDAATTADMEQFHDKLRQRSHYYNEASLKEIERARMAQLIFRPVKVATMQRFLDDEKYHFLTPIQVLGRSRSTTRRSARAKDNAERLDVFFDHLDRLERFTKPSFPEFAIPNLERCIQQTRSIVEAREGMQEHDDFETIVSSSFPPEMLMHFYAVEFLKMLAAIFGIDADKFRNWHREMLKRFDARDYEPAFRSVEMAIGKEVSKEARFRIHVNMVRGSLPAVVRSQMWLRVCVERHTSETSWMPGGAKVTWNETFSFHVYDEQSPIVMLLMQDGEAIGQGSFSIYRYPVGKPSKMWFPVPGALIPHAEVNIIVEVLPQAQVTTDTKKTRSPVQNQSQRMEIDTS